MELVIGKERSLLDALYLVIQNDMGEISKKVLKEDTVAVAKGAGASVSAIYRRSKNFWLQSQNDCFKAASASLGRDMWVTGVAIKNAPGRVLATTKRAHSMIKTELAGMSSDKERADFFLRLMTYCACFSAGAYMGYNTPDQDIKMLGIGKHRHWAFHSVLPVLAVAIVARLLCRVLDETDKYLSLHHEESDKIEFLKTNLKLLAFGTAIGTTAHLAIDGTLQGSKAVTSPYGGTFVPNTLVDDKAYLVFNALFCWDSTKGHQSA